MELEDIDLGITADLPENIWTTFASYNRIGLYSNNCIFTEPERVQFYIDKKSAVLFVRYTNGKLIKILSDSEVGNGYVKLTLNSVDYKVKLIDGGVDDESIGKWHDVYALDNITGIFK